MTTSRGSRSLPALAPRNTYSTVLGSVAKNVASRWTRNDTREAPNNHDSALNGSARFRWVLTEDEPTIKPYDENRWAELADSKRGAIEPSRYIVEGVTERLVVLLKTLTPKDWGRRFYHPEWKEHVRLDHLLALAAKSAVLLGLVLVLWLFVLEAQERVRFKGWVRSRGAG